MGVKLFIQHKSKKFKWENCVKVTIRTLIPIFWRELLNLTFFFNKNCCKSNIERTIIILSALKCFGQPRDFLLRVIDYLKVVMDVDKRYFKIDQHLATLGVLR